jgi:murein tripeptide amidase MpaA
VDDIWNCSVGLGVVHASVSPETFDQLFATDLTFDVVMEDIQQVIDQQAEERMNGLRADAFSDYMPYDDPNEPLDIKRFIQNLADEFPDIAETFVLGTTGQGREIIGIRLSGDLDARHPAVVYHGGIHAREWITPPSILYTANELARGYATNEQIRRVLDVSDWYLIPVLNVDGYTYSWTRNRLWRKNRRDNGNGTFGVDNNRNFSYKWGGAGSSGQSDSATYRGPEPMSEPENQAIDALVGSLGNVVAYCDVHSYSQLIMWPWGYTSDLPPDNDAFAEIGAIKKQIIESRFGTQYEIGPVYTTIYPASGVSVDHMYGVQGVLGFTYELRDTGEFGFLLPADQIVPQCEEFFPAVLFHGDFVTAPVRIKFPTGPPAIVSPSVRTTLIVQVSPGTETVDAKSVTLFARTRSEGDFLSYPAQALGDDLYEVTFPLGRCGNRVEWFISADSELGNNVRSPRGAIQDVYSSEVIDIRTLVSLDFGSDSGWTSGDVDDDAVRGLWARGDPEGTIAQPEDDHTPGDNVDCWVTDPLRGQGDGSGDVDDGTTTLKSAVYDLSGSPEAFIEYWRWYSNDKGAAPGSDVFEVDISADGGSNWKDVETVGPDDEESRGGWFRHEFRVADIVEPTDRVQLRFIASDLGEPSLVEAAVDDFAITQRGCENARPLGDLNCDGDVDFDDIDWFVVALVSESDYHELLPNCDPSLADANEDGRIDFLDIDAFVNLLL